MSAAEKHVIEATEIPAEVQQNVASVTERAGREIVVTSDAALAFLADLPLRERTVCERQMRDRLRTWAQDAAECLLEARAKEAEPVGGWEK